jgi:hypothetical protein
MSVQELYKRFLMMINKNDTNAGVTVLPADFVLLFNAEALRWLAEELKKDEDNIDVNKIDQLFNPNVKLTLAEKHEKFLDFTLPDDYFQVYGSYSFADRGPCQGVRMANYEKKPGNLVPILSDSDNRPSFDYQEAPFVLTENVLRLYFDDYEVKNTFVNYYRVPKQIDMAGYINFNEEPSTNIDPELDDYNNLEILARLAKEIDRQNRDGEGIQMDAERVNSEF